MFQICSSKSANKHSIFQLGNVYYKAFIQKHKTFHQTAGFKIMALHFTKTVLSIRRFLPKRNARMQITVFEHTLYSLETLNHQKLNHILLKEFLDNHFQKCSWLWQKCQNVCIKEKSVFFEEVHTRDNSCVRAAQLRKIKLYM
jgi:hypothetical protein